MDPTKLRHFLGVIEEHHFGRAARQLGVTQQTVSKSVARLEAEIGARLFDRTAYGASPTPIAETLAARARAILAEIEIAKAEIAGLNAGHGGHLTIGVGLTFAERVLPQALRRFRKARPSCNVTGIVNSSGFLYRSLLNGEFDLVVSAPNDDVIPDPDIRRLRLFSEVDDITVGRQHPLVRHPSPGLSDLSRCPWIVSASLPESWTSIVQHFTTAGVPPPTQLVRTDSITFARSLLETGDYIMLSRCPTPDRTSVQLPGIFPQTRRTAWLATRKRSRLQPSAQILADLIVETAQAFCIDNQVALG